MARSVFCVMVSLNSLSLVAKALGISIAHACTEQLLCSTSTCSGFDIAAFPPWCFKLYLYACIHLCSLDLQLSHLEASLAAADAPTLELLGQSTSRWMQAAGAAANQPAGVPQDAPASSCNDVQGVSSSSASSSKPVSAQDPNGQHTSNSTPAENASSSTDTSCPNPGSSQPSSSVDRDSSKQATDSQDAAAPVPGSKTAGSELESAVPKAAASGTGADSSRP
jgi:hypothetical protein